MAFTPRLTRPTKGNKYYIRKANGGYSNAILGYPTDPQCNVLANCVGYAYGRFNEIGKYGYCKYLAPVNAERFMDYKGSCQTGMTPKLGAVMVWQAGPTKNGSDGAGHVAIVEKIISPTEVVTSESGYGAKNPFWTQTRKKGSGSWGAGSGYKFLGFIYNPAVKDEAPTPAAPTTKEVHCTGYATSKADKYNRTFTVIARAGLNMRNGAGTKNKILTTMPYKANVRCYGYYSTVSGVAWPCVEYINEDTGTKYTGFVSSAYLS
jgi:surface antigen